MASDESATPTPFTPEQCEWLQATFGHDARQPPTSDSAASEEPATETTQEPTTGAVASGSGEFRHAALREYIVVIRLTQVEYIS